MKNDSECFGSGLEGYAQYNDTFKRNCESVLTQDSNSEILFQLRKCVYR